MSSAMQAARHTPSGRGRGSMGPRRAPPRHAQAAPQGMHPSLAFRRQTLGVLVSGGSDWVAWRMPLVRCRPGVSLPGDGTSAPVAGHRLHERRPGNGCRACTLRTLALQALQQEIREARKRQGIGSWMVAPLSPNGGAPACVGLSRRWFRWEFPPSENPLRVSRRITRPTLLVLTPSHRQHPC
jgi:hypothetical protein